jgi:hypothetical protein
MNVKKLSVAVTITCVFAASFCSAATAGNGTKAAELAQAVRESENWIHKVDSVYIRIESTLTRTPEGIAAKRAELQEQFPNMEIGPNRFPELKPVSTGILEYAIDRTRLRFLDEQPDQQRQLKIWDGKQLITHQASFCSGREQYDLKPTPQGSFQELLAYETSWPISQPHSFWFDRKEVDDLMGFYGLPEEFLITSCCKYRGVDCHALDVSPAAIKELVAGQSYPGCNEEDRVRYGIIGQARGLAGRSYRWYIGVKDNLLRGFVWLDNQKPYMERWMLDYRQVGPGCWFPMTQGQKVYEQDNCGQYLPAFTQELKVIDIRINEKLPDDLFKIEFKEGARISDSRFGRTVTYTYRPDPPDLTGKLLPKLTDINTNLTSEQINGGRILICFMDMQQRPSRHYIGELARRAEELKQKGITVVAAQASKINEKILNEWTNKYNIPFAVGTVQSDLEKTRYTWGVRSLPWLILTDQEHIVKANGFALPELDEKI